jgi:phage protein D
MSDLSQSGIISAQPIIQIDGQDLPDLSGGLLELLIVETVDGLYRCEAAFSNWGETGGEIGFLYFDRRTLDFGKRIQVKVGDRAIFTGAIMGLEAGFPEGNPPVLTVLAEDRLQDLRMTRRTRTFTNMSDADVFRQIAGDHGLTPNISLDGPVYPVLAQVNQSDLAFLRERARAVDAELWMDDRTLTARGHPDRGGDAVSLGYLADLREFSVLADLAGQRTEVSVSGWDPEAKQAVQYTAQEDVLRAELGSDQSGPAILNQSFGRRPEALVHLAPRSSAEAESQANAYFRLAARRFVVGRGVAATDPRLRAGAVLDLRGLGPLFSGRYTASEVRHMFDRAQGLRTEFIAERPGLGRSG